MIQISKKTVLTLEVQGDGGLLGRRSVPSEVNRLWSDCKSDVRLDRGARRLLLFDSGLAPRNAFG
jgi:hypothetical protein